MATNKTSVVSVLRANNAERASLSTRREHVIYLYEDDPSLSKTVADVVADGLGHGEPCLLIATKLHLTGISEELRRRGHDCDALEKGQRLAKVNAEEILPKITSGAGLDTAACIEVLRHLISRMPRTTEGSLVVYGELVDLLWKSGRPQTAIHLEQIWNELRREHPIRLLCGYSAETFGAEDNALLELVCNEHSICLPSGTYLASDERSRLRQILLLEQRARELEAEVERRRLATEESARFNGVALGREKRVLELKNEVNELCSRLGEPPRYGGDREPESDAPSPLPSAEHGDLAPLESILRTEELNRRPKRDSQYEAEHRALLELMQALADSPGTILQVLADKVLTVLNADSAGLSLLTDTGERFYWAAIAGMWKPHLGGGTPRNFGPCGDVLDCEKPLLFTHWELRYPYLREAVPLAEEGLLVPFFVQGKAAGTIWAIAHNPARKFDAEDLRLLEDLGKFASAAYQAVQTLSVFDQRQAALSLLEDAHRMQQSLQEKERQLVSVTENMAAAVSRCSLDFRYLWVSTTYAAWIGKSREEIAGRQIREVIGDAGFEDVRPYMERVLKGERVEFTTRVSFLGPGSRWIHGIYVPTYSEERMIDGWIAVVSDVTEERRLVETLREQAQLLDLTQDAVLSLRWDGVIEFWNRGAEERYGWSRKEAIGQVAHDLLQTEFPEPLPEIKRKLDQSEYWEGELGHSKRDGTRIVVASRWAVRRDLENRPIGYLEITTDITERKQAEEQSRQSQRLESLGVLAGGIAHDFNNLLVGILGNASLALDVLGPHTPATQILEDLMAASERAAALTRQMLAYAGKEQLSKHPINLSKLVRELAALLRASLPKHVHLVLDLPDEVPWIEGDSTQLQQVIMNLVINGAEAIPEGTPGTVTAVIACRKPTASEQAAAIVPFDCADQNCVVLGISDTGTGIPPGIRSHIFDPFYTTKFTGRGLGLSAVLGIVRAHGGGIALRTAEGKGTTFTVLLPVAAAPAQAEIAAAAPSAAARGTVLVVDDEPSVRAVAERALLRSGFQVLLAADGRAAIDRVAEHPEITAVVLDLAMPVMTGDQALPALRQLRPNLPIVLSSGYSESEARRRFADGGFTAFLQKPYKAADLADTVIACVGKAAKSSEMDRSNQ